MLSTRERVESFGTPSMRAIFASMTENGFRQESELAFIDAAASAFPMELLEKNCTERFGEQSGGGLQFVSLSSLPTLSDWQWLEANISGTLFAGYDVGRKKDEAVFFVVDNASQRLEARMMVRLSELSFSAQESLLFEAMRRGVNHIAIDSTGIGMPVAEKLAEKYGDRVTQLHFTAPAKEMLVSTMKLLLMDKKLLLPLERDLLTQIRSVQKQVTGSGTVIYGAPRSGGHHADIAWAVMLACHAARQNRTGDLHYESVSGRMAGTQHKTGKNFGRW